jgi:uncharacterized protein (TIGR03000 family)
MFRLLTSLAVLTALMLAPPLAAQEQDERGFLTLKVPADAKVEIDGQLSTQTGEVRKFASPPLTKVANRTYYYSIKVTYKGADGRDVTVEKRAQVAPGRTTKVDLAPAKKTPTEAKKSKSYSSPTPPGVAERSGNYSAPNYIGSAGSYGSSGYYDRYYDPTYRPPVGEHWVNGYYRSDGTYVRPHWQTNPDDSFYNNWSTKGNVNPHTGKPGTKTPYSSRRR